MKSAIPWVLVLALAGATYLLYASNSQKQAELDKLTQENQQVEQLRQENDELKKIPVQNDELNRLRKDNEDLLRLRSEVQQLRNQAKQLDSALSTAQAQAAQAQESKEQQLARLANENQSLKTESQKLQETQNVARTQIETCVQNLRAIDAAKQQWALENNKPAEAVPTMRDLAPYIPKGARLFCPGGGVYAINAVKDPPTCSVPGHTLVQQATPQQQQQFQQLQQQPQQ